MRGRKHRSKLNSLHWLEMAQHLTGLTWILVYTKQSLIKVEVKQISAPLLSNKIDYAQLMLQWASKNKSVNQLLR